MTHRNMECALTDQDELITTEGVSSRKDRTPLRVLSLIDRGAAGRVAAFGSVVDLSGSSFRRRFAIRPDPLEADQRAFASDWDAVGADLWSAVEKSRGE